MRWRPDWLIGDYVPPESGLPRDERRRLSRDLLRRHVSPWRLRLAEAPGWVLLLMAISIILRTGDWLVGLALLVLAVLAWGVLGAMLVGPVLERWIIRSLHRQGIRLCAQCGYRLHGHTGPGRCPECAAPFRADVKG